MKASIYLDNAATTAYKPAIVMKAVESALSSGIGNPGRGSHQAAHDGERILFDCRQEAADFFFAEPENVIITSGATHSLNLAIKGLARDGKGILIDSLAHNASYRPALSLRNRGCQTEVYDASGRDEEILSDFTSRIKTNTGLVIATHQSNVTSKVLPIGQIGEICRRRGIPFIVDASQSAGHIPIRLNELNISALCVPGHKGLYGPMGCGLLITDPSMQYRTVMEGGAGIHSLDKEMPADLPERLEAGTLPLPALAGLTEGIRWVRRMGFDAIQRKEHHLASLFCSCVSDIPGVRIIGDSSGSVISFTVAGASPSTVGDALNKRGVYVRCGLHCAPLAHKTYGTMEGGTVRVSFSYWNDPKEICHACRVLREELSEIARFHS